MDDPKKQPLLFANRAIQQYAKAFLEDDESLTAQDCTTIRVVYRQLGGTWEGVLRGDPEMIGKLSQSVKAWGQARKKGKSP
jgi:hypothetical protein